jgi:hypothetical protein
MHTIQQPLQGFRYTCKKGAFYGNNETMPGSQEEYQESTEALAIDVCATTFRVATRGPRPASDWHAWWR